MAFDRAGDRGVEVLLQTLGSPGRFRLSMKPSPSVTAEATRVGLAPWGRSLVRCRGIEGLAGDELVTALGVLGDGELPERVPAWRRACGALPSTGGGRTAVLTAWMPGDGDPADDGRETTYATAAAALGMAASLAEGCLFASDEAQGVLIVAANGPEGLLVRALREAPDVVGTDVHVAKRLGEASAAVGLPEAFVREALSGSTSAWEGRRVGWSSGIAAALAKAVQGWPNDGGDAATALMPVCAGMLALAEDTAMRSLAGIRLSRPIEKATAVQRVDAWLVSPRHVAAACVACLLLLLFAPLLAAKVREAMLSGKVQRAEELRAQYEADAKTAAIYRQLNERVWPMTKMLAEVTAAAPVHVVLESVRMDSGAQLDIEGFVQMAPRGPTIDGPPEGLLTQYEAALNKLGTLGAVTVVRREVVGDSVEFQISAQVRNATARASLPMDYAEMSLAEVLYGEGASNTAAPILASAGSSSSRTRPAASTTSRDSGARDAAVESGRSSTSDRRPSGESGPASIDGVPAPLTDEQIAAMDRATAMREWSTRRSASRDEKNNAETRARLTAEAEKLNEHFRSMGSGG